ncbi:MAG: hypothetical protein ACI9DQ_000598 [Glaciecola sp.]|jgi:uncharacterized protein
MYQKTVESRIAFLDILRGICICFILLANLEVFSGYYFLSPEMAGSFNTAGLDKVIKYIQLVFIEGKFYTLFSLLFGIGMVIQYQSFKGDTSAFTNYMRKRLAVLLLIGILHFWVLWFGDILTIYALLGLLVLYVFHWSSKTLLIVGISSILLPIAHTWFMGVVGFYPGPLFEFFAHRMEYIGIPAGELLEQLLYRQQTENFGLYAASKFYDPVVRIAGVLAEGRLFKVFGIMCIGVVAGRHILHQQLLSNRHLLKKVMFWGIAVGLPANIMFTAIKTMDVEDYEIILTILYAVGVVPLALGYAAGLALLLSKRLSALSLFAPIGRMALSNYMMQTLFAIAIFYGFGLALAGHVSLTAAWGIGLCVIVFQWLFSIMWLKYFKQGPLEYIWRKCIPK